MAKQTLNNSVTFGEQRTKINENFTELYGFVLSNLGALSTPITLDETGVYNVLTLSDDLIISFADDADHVEGNTKVLYIIGNDTYTLTVMANDTDLIYDGFVNGGVLVSGVVHRISFTFFNTYIDIDYTYKSIIEADVAPTTLTSATIENATDDVLDLVFADAVTITTAGWSIDTDGAALSISTVLSGDGTTTPKFQLSRSVVDTETITISYDSSTGDTVKTSNGVELANITDDAVVNNVDPISIILMDDDFNDNSIDTGKWTVSQPANSVVSETSSHLEIYTTAGATTPIGLITLTDYSSANDLIIVQAAVTQPSTTGIGCLFGIYPSTGFETDNRAIIARDTTTLGTIRCLIYDGGVVEVSTSNAITANPRQVRIKYVPSTGAITFEYWNGSAWTEFIGSAGNVDLGTSIKVALLCSTTVVDTSSFKVIYDGFYISDNDYSTQQPI